MAARKKVSNKRQCDKKKQAKKDAKKKAERDEPSSGAPHKIGGVLYEIGGEHGVQPSAKAARSGGNVGGTQLSPIQLDSTAFGQRVVAARTSPTGARTGRGSPSIRKQPGSISPRQWRGTRPRTRLCPGTKPRTRGRERLALEGPQLHRVRE